MISSEDGYLFLPLPPEAFASLPDTVTVGKKTLMKKKEFHVTLVHAASISEADLRALLEDYLRERSIAFIRFIDDIRLAAEPGRTSIAARCAVSNLEGLFDRIEERFRQRLPLQPAHVSLYIDADRGVGIDSEEEWQSHERLEFPEITSALNSVHI